MDYCRPDRGVYGESVTQGYCSREMCTVDGRVDWEFCLNVKCRVETTTL